MNWTENAKSDLMDYAVKKAGRDNLIQRIAELTDQMDNLKAVDLTKDRVQGGTQGNDALLAIIDEKTRLEQNLRMVSDFVDGMERGMKSLTDEEKAVLEAAYINGRPSGRYVEEVCIKINYSDRMVDYIRRDALKKFTMARYGIVEG